MDEYTESEENEIILDYTHSKYPTKYAIYSIYDDDDKIIHPDKCFIEGNVFIFKKTNYFTDRSYCSNRIKNPTYGDILLLVDDMIEHTQDTDHRFLESIDIDTQIDNNTFQISVSLGS